MNTCQEVTGDPGNGPEMPRRRRAAVGWRRRRCRYHAREIRVINRRRRGMRKPSRRGLTLLCRGEGSGLVSESGSGELSLEVGRLMVMLNGRTTSLLEFLSLILRTNSAVSSFTTTEGCPECVKLFSSYPSQSTSTSVLTSTNVFSGSAR